MLAGKKLLVTGVVTKDSIAFEVARQAQEAGAEIVLTGFGRARRVAERAPGPRARDAGARRGQAARAGRRARTRRQQRGRPRGGGSRSRRAVGTARRGAP